MTECPSCLALQDNDAETVRRAFDHTVADSQHAAAMKKVAEFTRANLPNRVLACPRCRQTCLFSTDWKGNATTFWAYGMDRLNQALFDNPAEWKNLIAGQPDCGFCEKLHTSEADAIAAIPWLIIAVPTGCRISANGIWSARLPLVTTGPIVGLGSYALLYVIFAISTTMGVYEAGTPRLVPAAMTLAVSFQLVESATRASTATAQALLFIPGLSGVTAGVVAVCTSGPM